MSDKTMTEGDLLWVREGIALIDERSAQRPSTEAERRVRDRFTRILATYRALAEAENTAGAQLGVNLAFLHRKCDEAGVPHDMDSGTLMPEGRVRWLCDALATAQEDSARLDRLAKWAATPLELDRMGGLEGDAPVGPFFLTFEIPEVTQYSAATLREVIDKVEATIQSTAIATSTPPEDKP